MKKIALMRTGGLGDFITAVVPLSNYFLDVFGECEFHFFMTSSNIGIAKYFFPEAKTYLVNNHNRLINYPKLGLQHRNIKPDISVNIPPDFPRFDSLFSFCLGAKERYGRIGGSSVAKLLLNHPSELYADSVDNSTDHNGLCALKVFDKNITEIEKKYYPKFKTGLLDNFFVNIEGPYVMVEVSNHRKTSQLSVEKTVVVLNKAYESYNFSVLITGMPKDENKMQAIASGLNMPAEAHLTKSLDEFLSYVYVADVVMCGDGGLSHIAAAMGKRVLALHGIITVEHWAPLGDFTECLYDAKDVNNIPNEKISMMLSKHLQDVAAIK